MDHIITCTANRQMRIEVVSAQISRQNMSVRLRDCKLTEAGERRTEISGLKEGRGTPDFNRCRQSRGDESDKKRKRGNLSR